MPNFTKCKRVPGKAYNGANGKKIAIEYKGSQYMLKFPTSAKDKPTALSYTNGCISEHIASSIFNIIGIQAQETILGTFEVNGREKLVCACKDFTIGGKVLYDFCSIKNTIIDSEHNGTGTELEEILEVIEKQHFVNPRILSEHFWNVFIVDALVGNFDRHNGNWGFIYNFETQQSEIAPVYDCGSCLLPQADDSIMQKILDNENELNTRVYNFPTSAIKYNERKINYYDFLMKAEYKECNAALNRIIPKINIREITEFINEVPYVSELQKKFYRRYIEARYEKIIISAYKFAMNQTKA